MGQSEWVFLVQSKADVDEVIQLVKSHNESGESEELEIYSLLKRNKMDKYYLCAGNGGGRDQTTNFIMRNYPKKTDFFLG